MRTSTLIAVLVFSCALGCDDEPDSQKPTTAADGGAGHESTFVALTYNVAGLPEGLSSSHPERNTPLIGPLLNDYDLVFLQESWLTPAVNPLAPLRVYHEILVAASTLPYKTPPADQPFGNDPSRPTALLSDGLNVFSRFPLEETQRVAWSMCVDTASDCMAFKGFSMTPAHFTDGSLVHVYDLHMEAGESEPDDRARDAGIDQLLAFMQHNSSGTALIVGGDFNLHTDREPAAGQFARLLSEGGLSDACAELDCPAPGNIDKLLFRSSASLELQAESWELESARFVTPEGAPLSDHEPVAVQFRWQAR
ncbi:MAG TPA: endonuclease/exonuclease/phosphatase family protein [Polyangiales bacterium]|nr:endonuclease/exonuclease/phosphatase family protein [Polyangiales bacterium]